MSNILHISEVQIGPKTAESCIKYNILYSTEQLKSVLRNTSDLTAQFSYVDDTSNLFYLMKVLTF